MEWGENSEGGGGEWRGGKKGADVGRGIVKGGMEGRLEASQHRESIQIGGV